MKERRGSQTPTPCLDQDPLSQPEGECFTYRFPFQYLLVSFDDSKWGRRLIDITQLASKIGI
jgi:hypothetical protein